MLEQFREEIDRIIEHPPMKDEVEIVGDFKVKAWVIDWVELRNRILSIKLGSHTLKEIIKMIDEGKLVKESEDQCFDFIIYPSFTETVESMLKAGFKKVEPLKEE